MPAADPDRPEAPPDEEVAGEPGEAVGDAPAGEATGDAPAGEATEDAPAGEATDIPGGAPVGGPEAPGCPDVPDDGWVPM